jgi:uncharacterized FAD-dependent dehydrogenase
LKDEAHTVHERCCQRSRSDWRCPGGDLKRLVGVNAWDLINDVDSAFLRYGAPDQILEPSEEDAEMLKRKAAAAGARFIPIKQRHMGSDRTPEIIATFKRDLEQKGVKFRLNSKVEDLIIEGDRCFGVKLADGTQIRTYAVELLNVEYHEETSHSGA